MSINYKSFIKEIKEKANIGSYSLPRKVSQGVKSFVGLDDVNKVVSGMTKNTKVSPGIMGQINYNKAINTTKKFVSKGDYKGARNYINEQHQKIVKQINKD